MSGLDFVMESWRWNMISERKRRYSSYWRKKELPIIGVLVVQITLMIFIVSVGCSLLYGLKYAIGFGGRECLVISPKEGKYEEIEALFEGKPEVERIIGGVYSHVRSKIIFFSTGGTPVFKLEPDDLSAFMKRFQISLEEGKMPKNEGEILVTKMSQFDGGSKDGKRIGKHIKNNSLEMSKDYDISGVIQSSANIMLGISYEKKDLMIIFNQGFDKEMELFLQAHQDLFQKRFSYTEVENFVQLFKRNLYIIGWIVSLIFLLQIGCTSGSLLEMYLKIFIKELALFHVVGYDLRQIQRQLIKRFCSIYFLGGVLGTLGGEVVVMLFFYLYCEVRGIYYALWNPLYFLEPVLMMSLLFAGSCIKYCKRLKTVDWINILQG